MATQSMATTVKKFLCSQTHSQWYRPVHCDSHFLSVTGCIHGIGIKPMSAASPWVKVARLSGGEGEARRKAGLMECSESLLLLLLNGRQGAAMAWWAFWREQPAEGEGSVEGAAILETSKSKGVVFGVPEGHRPFKSKEWTTLSSTSLVLWVHCARRETERSQD